jgi:4-hydroxy-tetrahydrodipicolinate synthase
MVDGTPAKGRKQQGSMTALVTPFAPDGAVDWACAARLAERQIEAGTHWLVPGATTGESPTLSCEERDRLLGLMIERARGRCGVLAYTGCNCTAETVQRTRCAAEMGADAGMIVAPYYNRPTPKGLFQHFAAVAEAVELPLVLYNVPARTGVSIPNDVVVRLRQTFPHITAIKHATGSVSGVTELLQQCDIAVLSGDDSLTWPLMALGAVGVVSVLGNLVPDVIESLIQAGLNGDLRGGQPYHRKVTDLAENLAVQGPNPLPIKAAMAAVGLIEEVFRLPLCPVDEGARVEIKALLRRHEIT